MNKIGMRIQDLLNEKNMTQKDLANSVGVSEVTISRYISGARSPRVEIIDKIATRLSVTTDYILGKSNERYYPKTEKFTTAEEAAKFLLKQQIVMSYGDFDTNKLSDDEKNQFVNELLQQVKLLAYKYKK